MKKFPFLLLLIALACLTAFSGSKKLKEGKVIFEITYPGVELDQQTMAMLPDQSTLFFKNEMHRLEIKMAMGSTVVISDTKVDTAVTLIDMMGNKMAIRMTKEDMEKERKEKGKPQVQVTGDKKEIAGYSCTKAIVTPEDTTESPAYEVWFTDEIEARNNMDMEGIDGFLMEFKVKQNNMTMQLSCTSVKEERVDAAMFVVPDGYKTMTMDELKNMKGRR